jgi:hypothetical protein
MLLLMPIGLWLLFIGLALHRLSKARALSLLGIQDDDDTLGRDSPGAARLGRTSPL